MRIGYWSSDVCSSDLVGGGDIIAPDGGRQHRGRQQRLPGHARPGGPVAPRDIAGEDRQIRLLGGGSGGSAGRAPRSDRVGDVGNARHIAVRSEEHTSELQSLMRISYALFCLKKKKYNNK